MKSGGNNNDHPNSLFKDDYRQKPKDSLTAHHFTLSVQTGLLAEVHNDLLTRINSGLKLIGEVDRGHKYYELLRIEISKLVDDSGRSHASRQLWMQYPGAAAAYLVLVAIYEYAHGDYWEFALSPLGIPNTNFSQAYWGRRFLWFLNESDLTLFDDHVLKYVGRILGHAMIPNDCFPEFFGHLLEPAVRSLAWMGLSDQDILGKWLGQSDTVGVVDKPVWEFLRYGGNVTEAFVSGVLNMARVHYETGLVLPALKLNLPLRIVEQYEEWLRSPAGRKSLSRSPSLKLDPSTRILLVFPDQKLAPCQENQICTWKVSVASVNLRGPSDIARRRGDDIVFNSVEMPIPCQGPYDIQLAIADNPVRHWRLDGMNSTPPWKAFSDRSFLQVDISRALRAEQTWFVIPNLGSIIVRDNKGLEQKNVTLEKNYLTEDWLGFTAIHVDLSTAASIEIHTDDRVDQVIVEYPSGEISFKGGDLLQSADISADHIELFGNALPRIVLKVVPGEEASALAKVKIRFSSSTSDSDRSTKLAADELISVATQEPGQIIFELQKILDPKLCFENISISVWLDNKRTGDLRFRWAPGLTWQWSADGREVRILAPEGTIVSEKRPDGKSRILKVLDGVHIGAFQQEQHEIILLVSKTRSSGSARVIPLRLCGPRWAFLKQLTDTPIWFGRPIKVQSKFLLKETENPKILFEARDTTWLGADLQSQWIVSGQEQRVVRLSTERIGREARWLIRLGDVFDTLRKFSNNDSYVYIGGRIHGFGVPQNVKVCTLHLTAPTTLRWAVELHASAPLEWSEECLEIGMAELLEERAPYVFFEASDKHWDKADIRAWWRACGKEQSYCALTVHSCSEARRWAIGLSPAVERAEKSFAQDSEVKVEARTRDMPKGEYVEIQLLKIRQHPHLLKTYEEWIRWAEGNRLRQLALDLLCDLNPHYWAPLGLLASELVISPELVRQAFHVIKHECPDCTILERQDSFKMNKDTYRRMCPALESWYNQKVRCRT